MNKNTNYNNSIINEYQKATENNPYQRVIVTTRLLDNLGDVSDKSILDIGYGFGRHIGYLLEYSERFNRIVGIDKSNDQIELCKEKLKMNDVEFYVADIINETVFEILTKESFDIV